MVKQKRKNWRKVNVDDVEEALEDERMVKKLKRKTGDAGAAELFTVDTKPSTANLSRAARREIARAKIFPPKAPRLGLSASEEQKVLRRERGGKHRPKLGEPEFFDLWETPAISPAEAAAREEAEASTVKRAAQKLPASVPKSMNERVGTAPAVLPAHEGQSMNPVGSSFEDLACMAAARQLEAEREVDAAHRKAKPMTHELCDALGAEAVSKMSEEEKVKAYRELVCRTAASVEDGEDGATGDGEAKVGGKKGKKEKSQAHRNKEKKRKLVDSIQAQKRAQKNLEKSVGDIGSILKEMKERDEWLATRKQYRQEMREQRKHLERTRGVVPKTRRLGRSRFAEEALLVPDAEAASKGLRAMPLKGSAAVRERMSSIVRRGLVMAPPEATRSEQSRHKRRANRLSKTRKFVSPLLRSMRIKK